MAEVKNSFISSKMNKDLDDRLIPNGEYRNAVNVSINKSNGENVGTAQTVLGNQLIIDYGNFLGASNLEVIGVLPDDNSNTIYSFLTNNILQKYVPKGSVGFNTTYPSQQGSSAETPPIRITQPGSGYSASATGSTTNVNVFNSEASGLNLALNYDTTAATGYNLINAGNGYPVDASSFNLPLITITGGGTGASLNYTTNSSGSILSITNGNQSGFGYAVGDILLIQGQQDSSLQAAQVEVSSVNTEGALMSATVKTSGSLYTVGDVVEVDGFDPVTGSAAQVTITSILPNDNFIVSFNVERPNELKTIAKGSFLNFSTLNPITGINLLEQLLFFTDNRNQPRKVNVTRTDPYYTTEDQISVAKYYPFDPIQLYQPSEIAGSVYTSGTIDAVSDSKTITLNSGTSVNPPTGLGVIGTFAEIVPTATGSGYSDQNGLSTTGGTGFGLTVNITVDAQNAVQTVEVEQTGSGYSNGDVVTIIQSSTASPPLVPDNLAQAKISVVKDNTFITNVDDWNTGVIKVNQTQTLPAGMVIDIVQVETNMQDAIDEYFPPQAEAVIVVGQINPPNPPISNTKFYVLLSSLNGDPELEGLNVHLKQTGSDIFEDTGSTVTQATVAVISGIYYFEIDVSPQINPAGLEYDNQSDVLFAIENPYFDSVFKDNANVDFLSDKFVRFSYRYKFDDGEYSLIAPFTQPTFIPEQDGYFLVSGVVDGVSGTPGDEEFVTDEERAYRSTEVKFMENKVNKVLLNIPLPVVSNNLNNDFKITEIDILYKESDQTTIKVVESIPITGNVFGTSPFYQYEYGSKPPFKTLPQSETTRVSDKVPVKALAQEVASNRVIYGNYQDKHTPPKFLNYVLAAESKKNTFTIGENNVENYTSIIEYPNASLKQNRTYEVGVVLADRFGRQSTVIFSKTKFVGDESFIASSIYTQYRTKLDNTSANSDNPIGGLLNYDGDSLKIQFIDAIQSFKSPNPENGIPGIYNGDVLSQDYNPLGWYSFKIVVKQTEQDYYNVYLPTAMAGYPLDATKEVDTTTHVVLFGDNINKIPRDLSEVGPTQREFPSSVRLFGRVSNSRFTKALVTNPGTVQFYPGRTASLSTSVGTIRDLFDYNAFPGINQGTTTGEYIFYNFDYISSFDTAGVFEENTYPDSSSLVARIEGPKIGVPIPTNNFGNNAYEELPRLNIFETAPIVSLLDIYYETTTAGKITNLNTAITSGVGADIFSQVTDFQFLLNEKLLGKNSNDINQSIASQQFQPLQFDGSTFNNPAANTCTIISIKNDSGNDFNEDGVPYHDSNDPTQGIFNVVPVLDNNDLETGSFRLELTYEGGPDQDVTKIPGLVVSKVDQAPQNGPFNLTFEFEFNNSEAEQTFNSTFYAEIENEGPTDIEVIDPGFNRFPPSDVPVNRCFNQNGCSPNIFVVNEDQNIATGNFLIVKATNGSKTPSLAKLGLNIEIDQIIDFDESGPAIGEIVTNDPRYFTIAPNEGQAAGTEFESADAIISIPQDNVLTTNRTYAIRLRISDGGFPDAAFVLAEYFIQFEADPFIAWNPDPSNPCASLFDDVNPEDGTGGPPGSTSPWYINLAKGGSLGQGAWYGGITGLIGQDASGGAAYPPLPDNCTNPNIICSGGVVEITIPIIVDNAPIRLYLELAAAANYGGEYFPNNPDDDNDSGPNDPGFTGPGTGSGSSAIGFFELYKVNDVVIQDNSQPKIFIPENIRIPAGSPGSGSSPSQGFSPEESVGYIELNPPDDTDCGESYRIGLRYTPEDLSGSTSNSFPVFGLRLKAKQVT